MILEIEVDSPTNADYLFATGSEDVRVRGAFKPARVRVPTAGGLMMALPDGLPGQRVRLDTERGVGCVIEPLHGPDHAATRATCAKLMTRKEDATEADVKFDPAERRFDAVHVPSWVAAMCKAVRGGHARLIAGKLPDGPPADARPRVFSAVSAQTDPRDATIADQNALIRILLLKLPAAERAALTGK